MKLTALFGATAILALATASTFAASHPGGAVKPVKTLWNQNSNYGDFGISSQNFTSGSSTSANSTAADDFVVPAHKIWKVTQVAIGNGCYDGVCNNSFTITFYKDVNGRPGKTIKTFSDVACSDSCTIKGIKLPGGTRGTIYWISVVINNCSFINGCGEYEWTTTTTVHGHEAVWENPGGAYGVCRTWGTLSSCFGGAPADLAFELGGKIL